eukprot:2541710-Rhodomonas_salina.4
MDTQVSSLSLFRLTHIPVLVRVAPELLCRPRTRIPSVLVRWQAVGIDTRFTGTALTRSMSARRHRPFFLLITVEQHPPAIAIAWHPDRPVSAMILTEPP